MVDDDNPKEELLNEARRTTHAVRAIARFVLIFVTYQVFAAIFFALAASAAAEGVFDVVIALIFFAGLLAILGLSHALIAGHSELRKSDRPKSFVQPSPAPSVSKRPRKEKGLLGPSCSCTKLERVGWTSVRDGVKFCDRCERVIPV